MRRSDRVPPKPGKTRERATSARTPSRRFPLASDQFTPLAFGATIEDHPAPSADDLAEGRLERLAGPADYRLFLPNGRSEFCGLADGFFVDFRDLVPEARRTRGVSAPNMLRVRVAGAGDGEYVTPWGDVLDFKGVGAAIIIEPSDAPPAEATFAGRDRAVHVYAHRDALARLYAGREHELPAVVRSFLAAELARTVARPLLLNPILLRCLEDLEACTLGGRSRQLFIQAKALEILCDAFETLSREEDSAPSALSPSTVRGVAEAQRLLSRTFATPPSLDTLAHAAGLSRTCLCTGFREITGMTVFDYVAELRMQQALAMLAQQKASITEIAHAVGFGHPSSFSTAVQRRFGASPSELRRRGMPWV